MKKKNFAIFGLAAVAALGLASCEKDDPVTPDVPKEDEEGFGTKKNAGLDIALNYQAKQGITLRDASFNNTVENKNYVKGDLLPTWKAFSEKIGVEIRDASNYTASKDDDYYTTIKTAEYKSETDPTKKIDLFYNSTSNINKMGTAGEAVNLLNYLDYMPNFSKWLDENPTMKKALLKNEEIYYTPYFDGYQDVERMFVMNTELTVKVLDATSFANFDTLVSGTGAAANTLQAAKYPGYMGDYNYPADAFKNDKLTVKALASDNKLKDVTINKTQNIIKQQNTLLASGATGKQLAEQFRAYLDTAFAGQIGEGKIFANYSEIFVGQNATYNADELIALMRVIKANPGVVTGVSSSTVVGLFPRGQASNRVDNIADFMQVWGVQGMTSKKEMLYFGADGTLNDAASTKQTYDALTYLSALYDEGLILANFWDNSGTSGTKYLDMYYGHTAENSGYGMLMYDYAASTGATNTQEDGIGTLNSKRNGSFKDTDVKGVRPIVPPLAYWATESDSAGKAKFQPTTQSLTDRTGKTLCRYSEENRSLKSNSWCVPTSADNKEDALKLMDYLFSTDGVRIQDFGPETYWTLGTVAGETAPVMSSGTKAMIAASGKDFWTFMRAYLGSTHGIGHVRETAIQIQSCNTYAQVGLNNLENAIAYGAVVANRVDKYSTNTWDTTVPTAGYKSINTTISAEYDAVTSFWSSDKFASSATGWVAVVSSAYSATIDANLGCGNNTAGEAYKYSDVQAQQTARVQKYLYTYASSIGSKAVPAYAVAA